jgi:hypothetical protein
MSLRIGAPYADRIENDGRILIYEGHDASELKGGAAPKTVDQPIRNSSGSLTQNGVFFEAANAYKSGKQNTEPVRVYEKIRSGTWTYNGIFSLIDAWQEDSNRRKVFKFKLELNEGNSPKINSFDLDHDRIIPASVKLEVWKRDRGRCIKCSSENNLHFDHIIPFSKGGTSLKSENIQLLCARHNLAKRDNIE